MVLLKINISNICCSPLIYQESNLFIGIHQIVQALLPLYKSMPTTPNHLLVLHVFGAAFWEERADNAGKRGKVNKKSEKQRE